ncbi:YggT family protein [Enterococcus faecium]|nr:YggT family protein [Enterococcus faecium]
MYIIALLLHLIQRAAYFYSIILMVYALLSWFPGGYQSGLGRFLAKICEPYISLFDRLPLRIGPLDFTILGAILTLNLAVQGLAQIVIWITIHLVY